MINEQMNWRMNSELWFFFFFFFPVAQMTSQKVCVQSAFCKARSMGKQHCQALVGVIQKIQKGERASCGQNSLENTGVQQSQKGFLLAGLLRAFTMLCKYPRRVDCAVSSNTWILESVFQGQGVGGSSRLEEKLSGGGNPLQTGRGRPNRQRSRLCWPTPSCSISPRSRADPGKTALVLS